MIKPKDEYILFVDKTKKTPKNQYFYLQNLLLKGAIKYIYLIYQSVGGNS